MLDYPERLKQTLTAAKALVEKGWTQGAHSVYKDGKVCYCTIGAIDEAAGEDVLCGAYRDARDHVMRIIEADTGFVHIAWWNDAPDRTQAGVVAMFDKAIATAP